MTIASLYVRLDAETSQFHRKMEEVGRRTERLGKQITRAGVEISQAISLPIIAAGFAAFHAALQESHRHFGPLFTAFEQLKAQFRDTAIAAGQQLTPVFLQLIQAVQRVVDWIASLVRAFRQLPAGVQRAIVDTLLFLAALGPTVIIIGKLVKVLGAIPSLFAALTSPVGLAVLAIAAFVAAGIAVVTHWEQVKLRMVLVWTAIKEAVFESVSGILSVLESLTGWIPKLGPVVADLRKNFDALADDSLAKSASQIQKLQAALDGAGKAIQTHGAITNEVKAVIDQYNESVRRLQAEAIALGPTFNFNAAMAQIFQTRLEGLIRTGNLSVTALQNLGRELLEAQRRGQLFASTTQAIQEGVGGAFEALGTRLGEIFAGMAHGFKNFGAVLEGILGKMLTTLGQVLIAYGVAGLAIKAFRINPVGAIAAGVALIALGSALGAAAQKTLEAGGGGGGGGTGAATAPASAASPSEGTATIVLQLQGDGVIQTIFQDPRNQDALAQALQDISGRQVKVVPGLA